MSNLNQSMVKKIEAGNLLEDQGNPKEALDAYLSVWKNMEALPSEKH